MKAALGPKRAREPCGLLTPALRSTTAAMRGKALYLKLDLTTVVHKRCHRKHKALLCHYHRGCAPKGGRARAESVHAAHVGERL